MWQLIVSMSWCITLKLFIILGMGCWLLVTTKGTYCCILSLIISKVGSPPEIEKTIIAGLITSMLSALTVLGRVYDIFTVILWLYCREMLFQDCQSSPQVIIFRTRCAYNIAPKTLTKRRSSSSQICPFFMFMRCDFCIEYDT